MAANRVNTGCFSDSAELDPANQKQIYFVPIVTFFTEAKHLLDSLPSKKFPNHFFISGLNLAQDY